MVRKNLLIIGHATHGKDSLAEILYDFFGFTFESSSEAAARLFLFDKLKEKYRYHTFVECLKDRVNHRAEWHDEIYEYNSKDKARLAKEILKASNIYVGMRNARELAECKNQRLFDLVIGVFDPNKPLEDESSMQIDIWKEADIIIPNSGTIVDLEHRTKKLKPLLIG